MRIRLNGWQRIGLVISAAWLLAVAAYGVLEYAEQPQPFGAPTYFFFDVTKKQLPPVKDLQPGRLLSDAEFVGYRLERQFRPDRLVLVMVVPVVLFWVLAYAFVLVVRWVMVGFRKNGP